MVKQRKIVRDARGPSKVPAVVISVSGKSRKCSILNGPRRRAGELSCRASLTVAKSILGKYRRKHVLRMPTPKTSEAENDGETGSSKDGGGGDGAQPPGDYSAVLDVAYLARCESISLDQKNGTKIIPETFLSTGRTGRRNAIVPGHGHHAETGTAELSTKLEALTTDSAHDEGASTSQQQMG